MVVSAGTDAAFVAASLIDLEDDDDMRSQSSFTPTLYVSAASSPNRTNGTLHSAERCLPSLQRVIVEGSHFDFIQQSSSAISTHIVSFFDDHEP